MQERLVVPRLELVRANEETIRVRPDLLGDLPRREAVEDRLVHLRSADFIVARERDDGLVPALALGQVAPDRVEILDGPLDAVGHDHRPGLAADLALREDLVVEVVHHDLGLEPNRMLVALDEPPQLLLRLLRVELRVLLDRLREPVARMTRQRGADQAFETLLGGVGGHPSGTRLGIETSLIWPGRTSAIAARISSTRCRTLGHAVAISTTIPSPRPATFCWCRIFWSVVTITPYLSASALRISSPFSIRSQPLSADLFAECSWRCLRRATGVP